MQRKENPLSPNCIKVLEILHKSEFPLTAYAILEKMRRFGVKAPPTVYRALDVLLGRGLVHRIESLGAFVACHEEEDDHHGGAQFAVCRACGTVTELHDHQLTKSIHTMAKNLNFHVEREMLELMGICGRCDTKAHGA